MVLVSFAMSRASRTPLSVTLSVWRALFLREMVARLGVSRAAWLWLLAEPVVHILFILVLFTVVRMRVVPGADVAVWLMVGIAGFFTARNVFQRSTEAINANSALFAYRQVLPVDTVIVRAAVEVFIGLAVAALLMVGLGLGGHDVIPHDPLTALLALMGLCLCGLGLGFVLAVVRELAPELGKVLGLLFTPLYFISGVLFPVLLVPAPYRETFFYNPFAHGLELIRGGFFPLYHVAPEASLAYLYGFALVTVFIGLLVQVRYAVQLRAQ